MLPHGESWPSSPRTWWPFFLGLVVVYGLFDFVANAVGSDRGQHGVLVCALVLSAIVAVSRGLLAESGREAIRNLGLGVPKARGMVAALVACALLMSVAALYVGVGGSSFTVFAGWPVLVPGLVAQAGIAEEALFRGYLFGHLRRGRPFWQAAWLSSVPFILVHLVLLFRLPWPIAVASIALAFVIAFPLAWLYEIGGRTIWAPALVHAVVQGVPKILTVDGFSATWAITWIAGSAVLPFAVFAFREPPVGIDGR